MSFRRDSHLIVPLPLNFTSSLVTIKFIKVELSTGWPLKVIENIGNQVWQKIESTWVYGPA